MLLRYMMQCSDTRLQCVDMGPSANIGAQPKHVQGTTRRSTNPQEGQGGESAFAYCEPRCYAWGTLPPIIFWKLFSAARIRPLRNG